jgi:hypothetical protein
MYAYSVYYPRYIGCHFLYVQFCRQHTQPTANKRDGVPGGSDKTHISETRRALNFHGYNACVRVKSL